MSRLIVILLIPLCLIGQPLPHAHGQARAGDSAEYAARPHVHFHQLSLVCGLDGCPDHGGTNSVSTTSEHDQDAIYLGDFRADGSLKKVSLVDSAILLAAAWDRHMPSGQLAGTLAQVVSTRAPLSDTPIFLLTGSLRI